MIDDQKLISKIFIFNFELFGDSEILDKFCRTL